MAGQEYTSWIRKFDAKMRIANRKVLLFVDNCPAHPVVDDIKNVKVVFLPKNCTSKLQPMDMGIIRNLKHFYRTRLVRRLNNFIGKPNVQRKEFFINMYQVLHFLMVSFIRTLFLLLAAIALFLTDILWLTVVMGASHPDNNNELLQESWLSGGR